MTNLLLTLSAVVGTTLAALLNSVWLTLAFTVAAALALKFIPQVNAATRYAVWWAVLAMFLVLPFVPQIQFLQVSPPAPVVATGGGDPEVSNAPILAPPASATPAMTRHSTSWFPVEIPDGAWLMGIFVLWTGAFLLRLGQVWHSFQYLSGVKRRARRVTLEQRHNFDAWVLACHVDRPVRLLLSSEITSPIAVGFRHPAVIVPETLAGELEESDMDHVLLHELAHIARRDDWTNLIARLVGAALALHPIAAWVLKKLEQEREIACDDWVVSMTGDARSYAASLTRLFELCCVRQKQVLAAGMADRGSHLGERIEMLLRAGREFAPEVSMRRVAFGALILAMLVLAGAQMPPWIAFAQQSLLPAAPTSTPTPTVAAAPRQAAPAASPAPSPASVEVRPQAPVPAPARAVQTVSSGGSFLAQLAALGYGNLSVDEIIQLKIHGVSGEYINGMNNAGWGKLTPQQLVSLRIHDVSQDYLQDMKDAGITNLSLENVVSMRIHGVDPDSIQEMQRLGLSLTQEELLQFRIHDVSAEFINEVSRTSLGKLTSQQLVSFRIHGVDAAYIKKLEDSGFRNLTPDQIVSLRIHGVD